MNLVCSTAVVVIIVKVDRIHQLVRLCVLQLKVTPEFALSVRASRGVGLGSLEHGCWSGARSISAYVQLLVLELLCQATVHSSETLGASFRTTAPMVSGLLIPAVVSQTFHLALSLSLKVMAELVQQFALHIIFLTESALLTACLRKLV